MRGSLRSTSCAALVGLPVRTIAAIGLALVCGHNLLDGVGPEHFGVWAPEVFGRVPLFFYVLHIVLAHLAAGLIALWMGFGTAVLGNIFLNLPDGWGFGLGGVYLAWACLLAVLYPACRWFARIRRRRTDWWLAYL